MFKKSMALILSMAVLFGMLAPMSTDSSFAAVSKTVFKSVADVKGYYVISKHMAAGTLLAVGNKTLETGYRNEGESVFTMNIEDPSEIKMGIRVGTLTKDKKTIYYGTGYEVYCFTKNKQGTLLISMETEDGKVTPCKFKSFSTFSAANKFLAADKTIQAEVKKEKAEIKARALVDAANEIKAAKEEKKAKDEADKIASTLAKLEAMAIREVTAEDPAVGTWKSSSNDNLVRVNNTDKKMYLSIGKSVFDGIAYENEPLYLKNDDGSVTVTYIQVAADTKNTTGSFVAITFKNRTEMIRIDSNIKDLKDCSDIGIEVKYTYLIEAKLDAN